jgi:hypothetical protein
MMLLMMLMMLCMCVIIVAITIITTTTIIINICPYVCVYALIGYRRGSDGRRDGGMVAHPYTIHVGVGGWYA